MKNFTFICILTVLLAFGVWAWSGLDAEEIGADGIKAGDVAVMSVQTNENIQEGKALVAYFAYSENMLNADSMAPDAVTSASLNAETDNAEGNLQLMARLIQEKTGADVFHILVEQPYDPDYSTMRPQALEQIEKQQWPALREKVDDLEQYSVIYLGLPVWGNQLPPAMHTFFEENDLRGKIIVPFCIHLGSGFGQTLEQIARLAPGAALSEGFAIRGDESNETVKSELCAWLEK